MTMENAQVFGALVQGYLGTCLNLNVVAGRKVNAMQAQIKVNEWYPLEMWVELQDTVLQSYKNAEAILLRVGIEMMQAWYHYGPGRKLVSSGVGFLRYQTGSGGFESVLKGPREMIGSFSLEELDEEKGLAVVHSTTPFDRDMERGVLIGGMLAPGDLDYVDVVNAADRDRLEIEFH
jgi:hypothetical protein